MKAKKVIYIILLVLSIAAAIAGTVYVIDRFLKKNNLLKKEYLPCEITVEDEE